METQSDLLREANKDTDERDDKRYEGTDERERWETASMRQCYEIQE